MSLLLILWNLTPPPPTPHQAMVTNVWLVNLAVADFIFSFTQVFYIHRKLTGRWPYGLFLCWASSSTPTCSAPSFCWLWSASTERSASGDPSWWNAAARCWRLEWWLSVSGWCPSSSAAPSFSTTKSTLSGKSRRPVFSIISLLALVPWWRSTCNLHSLLQQLCQPSPLLLHGAGNQRQRQTQYNRNVQESAGQGYERPDLSVRPTLLGWEKWLKGRCCRQGHRRPFSSSGWGWSQNLTSRLGIQLISVPKTADFACRRWGCCESRSSGW